MQQALLLPQQSGRDVLAAGDDVLQQRLEARRAVRVAGEEVLAVDEVEDVQDQTAPAGHRAAAQDVHPAEGERAADVREEVRLVQRHHRQLPGVAAAIEQRMDLVVAEIAGKPDVPVDLRRIDAGQVAPRKALEDVRQLVGRESAGRPLSSAASAASPAAIVLSP